MTESAVSMSRGNHLAHICSTTWYLIASPAHAPALSSELPAGCRGIKCALCLHSMWPVCVGCWPDVRAALTDGGPVVRATAILDLGLAGPFLEELLFRGVLQSSLTLLVPDAWAVRPCLNDPLLSTPSAWRFHPSCHPLSCTAL